MLIVVGILVVLATMAIPALVGPLRRARLRDAAQQVRIELNRARLQAIETGVPQAFRYQPGGGRFTVSPLDYDAQLAVDHSFADGGAVADGHFGGAAGFANDSFAGEEEGEAALLTADGEQFVLDAGIRFCSGENEASWEGNGAEDDLPGESGVSWGRAIVFYPNGRARDARVGVRNERGEGIEIRLRGLTGAVSLGPLERELPEERSAGGLPTERVAEEPLP